MTSKLQSHCEMHPWSSLLVTSFLKCHPLTSNHCLVGVTYGISLCFIFWIFPIFTWFCWCDSGTMSSSFLKVHPLREWKGSILSWVKKSWPDWLGHVVLSHMFLILSVFPNVDHFSSRQWQKTNRRMISLSVQQWLKEVLSTIIASLGQWHDFLWHSSLFYTKSMHWQENKCNATPLSNDEWEVLCSVFCLFIDVLSVVRF